MPARPPPDPRDGRFLAHPARRAPCAHNRRASYQEWRRDRPVEATTTYRRRVGKVPIPGRSACTIRELPSRPFRAGRVFPFRSRRPTHPFDRGPMTDATSGGSPRQRFREPARRAPAPRRRRPGHAPVQSRRAAAGLPRGARHDPSGDGRGRASRVPRGGRRADRDPVVRGQPTSSGGLGPRGTGRRASTGARRSSPARPARSVAATPSSVARSGRWVRRRGAGRPSPRPPRGPRSASRSTASSRAART